MADCDLIRRRRTGEVSRGLFFVRKKSGKYRLIADGRIPSCHYRDSDPVALASGAASSAIEVDSSAPIQVGLVDSINAFYNTQLPETLRGIFAPSRTRADLVNISSVQGRAIRRGQCMFPVLKVTPTGWKLSLWACQQVLEHRSRLAAGVSEKNVVVDHLPPPSLAPFAHTEYVGNCFALGEGREVVKSLAEEVQQELHGADPLAHPVEAGPGVTALGWTFSDENASVGLNPGVA